MEFLNTTTHYFIFGSLKRELDGFLACRKNFFELVGVILKRIVSQCDSYGRILPQNDEFGHAELGLASLINNVDKGGVSCL